MKKRLRWILISVPLLVVVILAGIFLFRNRCTGEVLLNQVLTASADTYLLQVREVGARQIKLADGTASRITYSPNGRYLAFVQNGFETLLFDTNRPRRAALRLDRSVVSLLPLDDGSLLYVVGDAVYRTDGKQTTCYPSCEGGMGSAQVVPGAACVRDGKLITGTSAGCAIPFGLALVEVLKGADTAKAIAEQIVIR